MILSQRNRVRSKIRCLDSTYRNDSYIAINDSLTKREAGLYQRLLTFDEREHYTRAMSI